MIEKSRLEELIRQGATVWSSTLESKITLNEKCYVYLDANYDYRLFAFDAFGCQAVTYLEDLEEDVETVKFKCKYQNITRPETLSLPSWEEFVDNDWVDFTDKCYHSWHIFYDGNDIILSNEFGHYDFDYSKEGYIKACEQAKKLFLGEVVE